MSRAGLVIRDAEVEGVAGRDVHILDGRIVEVGVGLTGAAEMDARGGALIPGLIDHHIHLLATAARAESLSLEDARTTQTFAARLTAFAAARPPGAWVRAIGYHERVAGLLGREDIDALVPGHPVRIQHQTGGLWMLNSAALALVDDGQTPLGVERDAAGRATGRIWRSDDWLRTRIGKTPPALAPLGARLAAAGVTGLMDASVTTGPEAAATLADAHRSGALPQRLGLMSGGPLTAPQDGAYALGPFKILLDDHDLPPLEEIVDRMIQARAWGRAVAVHCVTAGELAVTLAAFEAAGSALGDRIEHGGMIPAEAIAILARLGLTVVTQPGFVFERGDRYLADIDPAEHGDLYRCASLAQAGVAVAASSDAPYSSPDPWSAMRSAVHRRTRDGAPIGLAERVSPARALRLFTGGFDRPGGEARRVAPGRVADLCLLQTPLRDALAVLSAELVAATFVDGRVVHEAAT
jgi:predicted amidohydrolase YtcJ